MGSARIDHLACAAGHIAQGNTCPATAPEDLYDCRRVMEQCRLLHHARLASISVALHVRWAEPIRWLSFCQLQGPGGFPWSAFYLHAGDPRRYLLDHIGRRPTLSI